MSLNEFNFSLVLKELLRRSLSFSPAMTGWGERDRSSPLRATPAESAVADAARINWRRFKYRSLGGISDDLMSFGFLMNIRVPPHYQLRTVSAERLTKSLSLAGAAG